MISFISQSTGAVVSLKKGRLLGRGVFGQVFDLLGKQKSGLVCKIVDVGSSSGSHFVLSSVLRELHLLKKLNLLGGYARKGDKFFIVMKKIKGEVASFGQSWPCFKELRALHRSNISHGDPHLGNFMVSDGSPNKIRAIDFGCAQDASYANCAWDFYFFSESNLLNFKEFLGFFVTDMLEYANQHKFETAQNILISGAITLAAIYGIPALAITHLMVQEFLSSLLISKLGKEIIAGGLDYFTLYALGKYAPLEHVITIFNCLSIAKSCLSAYLMYSNLSYHYGHASSSIQGMLSSGSYCSWKALFTEASPETLMHTALMYFPIKQLIKNLEKMADDYLPVCALKRKADLLYHYLPSKGINRNYCEINNTKPAALAHSSEISSLQSRAKNIC